MLEVREDGTLEAHSCLDGALTSKLFRIAPMLSPSSKCQGRSLGELCFEVALHDGGVYRLSPSDRAPKAQRILVAIRMPRPKRGKAGDGGLLCTCSMLQQTPQSLEGL